MFLLVHLNCILLLNIPRPSIEHPDLHKTYQIQLSVRFCPLSLIQKPSLVTFLKLHHEIESVMQEDKIYFI